MTPTSQPRQRWYHRFAVVRTNIETGYQRIESWHIFGWRADNTVAGHVLAFIEHPGYECLHEYRTMRAGHPLVWKLSRFESLNGQG